MAVNIRKQTMMQGIVHHRHGVYNAWKSQFPAPEIRHNREFLRRRPMNMKRISIFCGLLGIAASFVWAGVNLNEIPEKLVLAEDLGSRIDGKPWSSEELKGKVSVLFYVDPDFKDLNNDASDALKNKGYPREKFQSFAVINMAATWLPNFAISSALKDKQKRYPTTIYIRDYKKVLVQKWGLADDNSVVLAFDKEGRLLFRKDGKLGPEETETLLATVERNLNK
jgi:predicted transcriptional regulator